MSIGKHSDREGQLICIGIHTNSKRVIGDDALMIGRTEESRTRSSLYYVRQLGHHEMKASEQEARPMKHQHG